MEEERKISKCALELDKWECKIIKNKFELVWLNIGDKIIECKEK